MQLETKSDKRRQNCTKTWKLTEVWPIFAIGKLLQTILSNATTLTPESEPTTFPETV